ncbi:hypothetical protein HOLDEFILI_01105 [Holdemania filiformis DSM 12042]|uniref:Uncharacterized protein n=1 Tax=Holdemania filiformis DSM 12042 TaxID=545696 RepID=B9Y5M3_9FIRM|nr:hypothetical protein HOLDEFILI_01105 [Holdemania filiformis DSM 12042]
MQKRMGDCSFLKLKMLRKTDEFPKKQENDLINLTKQNYKCRLNIELHL